MAPTTAQRTLGSLETDAELIASGLDDAPRRCTGPRRGPADSAAGYALASVGRRSAWVRDATTKARSRPVSESAGGASAQASANSVPTP